MNRYLIALLASGFLANIACAGNISEPTPLQVASLEKTSDYVGYKSDLLDKKMLNKTMEESLRALTWDDRRLRNSVANNSTSAKSSAKAGDKE